MISDKQTEANRLNAQKSTGPITDAGKAISSQNAFKSGLYAQSMIIPGERLEDFQALSSEYYERCQPATPEERACVDLAIRHEWFLRRYTNVECQFWIFGIKGQIRERPGFELGYVFNDQSQQFARLQRMVSATQKSLFGAIHELERLQKDRRAASQPAETKPTKPANGFVSSTAPAVGQTLSSGNPQPFVAAPEPPAAPVSTPVAPEKSVPAAPGSPHKAA